MGKIKRHQKQKFYIIVEGKTEEIYFNQIKQLPEFRGIYYPYVLEVVSAKSINELFKFFQNGKIGRDGVTLEKGLTAFIFDKDHLTREQLNAMLANDNYIIGFSNPSFELWLLAHFVELRNQHADVSQELLTYFPMFTKASVKITDLSKDYAIAISNSALMGKPDFEHIGTSVGNVIEYLLKK